MQAVPKTVRLGVLGRVCSKRYDVMRCDAMLCCLFYHVATYRIASYHAMALRSCYNTNHTNNGNNDNNNHIIIIIVIVIDVTNINSKATQSLRLRQEAYQAPRLLDHEPARHRYSGVLKGGFSKGGLAIII